MAASATAGNFSPALLQKVVAKMDAIWADNQTVNDYVPNVEVLTAIRKEQTAKLKTIEDPEKDKVLKIIWVADCSTGVSDCEDDDDNCDFSGPEAEAKSKDYALDECSSVKFSIEENVFYTSELNQAEVLAVQMLARMKELDEYLAQKTVTKLNSFVGVNQYEDGIGQVDGVTTYIPANYWTPDMYGYFNMVKTINKLNNPFLVHGENLYQQNWMLMNEVGDKATSDKNKANSMRSYWDIFNIPLMNTPLKVSYMIAKGAVAFANKARYPLNNPRVWQFGKRWSIESKGLPGVYYDVFYKERCVMVDGEEKIYYDFKIRAKYGVYLNPFGCNEDVTGVLKFVCGNVPAES